MEKLKTNIEIKQSIIDNVKNIFNTLINNIFGVKTKPLKPINQVKITYLKFKDGTYNFIKGTTDLSKIDTLDNIDKYIKATIEEYKLDKLIKSNKLYRNIQKKFNS